LIIAYTGGRFNTVLGKVIAAGRAAKSPLALLPIHGVHRKHATSQKGDDRLIYIIICLYAIYRPSWKKRDNEIIYPSHLNLS
jgi:hypothetical protein